MDIEQSEAIRIANAGCQGVAKLQLPLGEMDDEFTHPADKHTPALTGHRNETRGDNSRLSSRYCLSNCEGDMPPPLQHGDDVHKRSCGSLLLVGSCSFVRCTNDTFVCRCAGPTRFHACPAKERADSIDSKRLETIRARQYKTPNQT